MKLRIITVIILACVMLTGCNLYVENVSKVTNTSKGTTSGDDFIYELTVNEDGNELEIFATLEYVGDEEFVEITHAASPFYFYITEETRGIELDYAMDQPSITTKLKKGEKLKEIYTPSRSSSNLDSKAYKEFIEQFSKGDFPPGEYEIKGAAKFTFNGKESDLNMSMLYTVE